MEPSVLSKSNGAATTLGNTYATPQVVATQKNTPTAQHVSTIRTDAAGRYRANVFVPNTPHLLGVRHAMQAGLGPTNTAPLGLDLSNGLWLIAGR